MSRVTCCSLSKLKAIQEPNDVNLFIVRNPKGDVQGLTVFSYLAPSSELYSFAMENKNNPNWWNIYKEAFELELDSRDKQIGLQIVQDYLMQGMNVNLVCYCGNPEYCHRSLVGNRLKEMGCEVRIL